ncbi:ActS/PrrB/RegB family redox-sensitive histidine kinase [Rhizobium rhizoryzae]|uniref:ActS/PrrB/RegB family redox-sensitive histidine kinase n=1 Tax=Rhizobium rhizoryzae TaxID=451876 RepID=UPI0028AABB0B|nr:ActS/PrrB/RegB family redox-sensitive histidine kinase [Rhizobium rhizoryzae]
MESQSIRHLQFGRSSRSLRLQTLIWLRWLAVAGQALTVFVVAVVLHFDLPLLEAILLIGALGLVNLTLALRYPPTHRLQPGAALVLLGFDLLQMGGLLFITGGLANPFASLLCVPVIISFASLPLRHSLCLLSFAMSCATLLALTPYPVPWQGDENLVVHRLLLLAFWAAIVSMMAFAAFYAYRVSMEATLLADALAATELVLEREKHLSQLDGLAAAAAHELGTPLATISVVAKEMERELKHDEKFGEDVALLRSQSERCRDILRRLTSLSAESEDHLRRLPLSSLVEEVIAPHRQFEVEIALVEKGERESEPVGARNAAIMYGLGNLIENAVDFARSRVTITVEHNIDVVAITIEDDGTGFAPDVLTHIGEPYMSSRSRQDERAGGLGLGLFIAKTLLERSGAKLTFTNRATGASGAQIRVVWPRSLMDINSERAI